jgi:hypothetical protein
MATKSSIDVQAALAAARAKKREQAVATAQKLAAKLASGAELSESELEALDSARKDGVENDEFDRMVTALARANRMAAKVADFDFGAAVRQVRSFETALAAKIAKHRADENELAGLLSEARQRLSAASAAQDELNGTRQRYPSAFQS